jgi:predicted nucleic acid-binding protein
MQVRRFGANDLLIASIALARNSREFERIVGVQP